MERLSKTAFLWYLDAPMHLWALAHNQIESKPLSSFSQYQIWNGNQVEALAHDYLESFILPTYACGELLWQLSCSDEQFEIRADALILDKNKKTYDLYEIKSATSVQKEHLYDVTFQALLLNNQFNLDNIFILYINKSYLKSATLDLKDFFITESVTFKVRDHWEDISQWREEAFAIMNRETPPTDLNCAKPKTCPCPELCHPQLPKYSVYNIPYIGKKAKELIDLGIRSVKEIPDQYPLNTTQIKHVLAHKIDQPLIDIQGIRNSLSKLEHPLYFLDYETFNPAIPLYPNYHPYEHIVFQYALYVMEKPGSEPQHFDCLISNQGDPAPIIIPHLLTHLGSKGNIIVWNKSFESHRNDDLAKHCPGYSKKLQEVNSRLFDLMLIFRNGYYIDKDFMGSASLKAVLPVICPELGYDDLAIRNGEEAMLTWFKLQNGEIPPEEHAEIIEDMKAYCRLDAYGMVAILSHLEDLIRSKDETT
jgi:hypothetical protein